MRKLLAISLIFMVSVASASVRKEVSEGETVTVKLSSTDPNVIAIKGDRIIRIAASKGAMKQNLDAKTGVLTLKPAMSAGSEPFSAIIFTEKEKRYNLLILPVAIPSQDIVLQPDTFQVSGPIEFESRSPYSEMVTSLIRSMVIGEMIEGYQIQTLNDEFKPFDSGKLKLRVVYQGDKVRGEILEFRGPKEREHLRLKEEFFYGPKVLAVALSKSDAFKDESITVFRVVRNG